MISVIRAQRLDAAYTMNTRSVEQRAGVLAPIDRQTAPPRRVRKACVRIGRSMQYRPQHSPNLVSVKPAAAHVDEAFAGGSHLQVDLTGGPSFIKSGISWVAYRWPHGYFHSHLVHSIRGD